jgi:hypothetical protein
VHTLVKINAFDVPWHLATARLAFATGHWPTENTFSYTFPHYPIYQQYPVFQALLYGLYKLGGWAALSLLITGAFGVILLLFMRWGGPLPRARVFHLGWMLVLFSFHTRLAARPDLLSLTLLGALLLALDRHRAGRRWALVAVPLLHWLWVNSHQLFVFSFAIQGLFIAHLVAARLGRRLPRLGLDPADAAVPLWPAVAAFAASLGASLLGPLGLRVTGVFAHTSGSLAAHRAHVQELARLWSDPVWAVVAAVLAVAVLASFWRSRRALHLFDVGLWLFGVALVLSAIRGLVYFTLISGAVLQRGFLRCPPDWGALSPFLRRTFRALALAGTLVLALAVVRHRWFGPAGDKAGLMEAGLGRSRASWPDAALAALKPDPPPGRMMNIPWVLANDIIWDWPEQKVFVDPRFESYPRQFLVDCLHSYSDDALLDRLIGEHQPTWIWSEHCSEDYRERLAHLLGGGGWEATYADAFTVVLVARRPETASYRARHPLTPAADPGDLVPGPASRRARQRLCYARVLRVLGLEAAARDAFARAAADATGDEDLTREIAGADHRP